MEIRAPKGTADILPPDSERLRRLQGRGIRLFRLYGYREIILPVMEYTDVFSRSIGSDTDIVQKEMFTFQDKGGRSLTLRPEATAGVVRAFVEHRLDKAGMPLKLYYQGPMFRQERPQAGRYRQFRQMGVEFIGASGPTADAEVILLCREFLNSLGLRYDLVINSVGDERCRPSYVEALKKYLVNNLAELCGNCRGRLERNPLRVLDCKEEKCAAVIAGSPDMEDFICDECREHYRQVEELLRTAQADYRKDGRLVRGLDYYTRTVFEFQDPSLGAQNTLAAGGRYDRLVEELGGEPTPAVGFSIGLDRIMLAGPSLEEGEAGGVYVMSIGDKARRKAFLTARRLREAGIVADLDHLQRSPKAQMREADRAGYTLCAIIGEDEMEGGFYTLRDMESGKQDRVNEPDLLDYIKRQARIDDGGAAGERGFHER